MKKIFRSGNDHAQEKYGAARLSHSEEFLTVQRELKQAGSYIAWRENQYAYSPGNKRAGHLILDPNASIAALRHELQHFRDDAKYGFPGIGYYLLNPDVYWQMEFRGYFTEIAFAREQKDFDLARKIIKDMRERRAELLGY